MHGDVPTNIFKRNFEVHLNLITEIIDKSFRKGVFPEVLRCTEVSPIFKKNDSLNKNNLSVFFLVTESTWKVDV